MTPDELDAHIQEHGLRILCRNAFLYFLNHLKDYPGNYLEIGVYEGFALRELAKAYPNRTFFGVDPFIEDGHTTGHNGVPKGERMEVQRDQTYRNIEGIPNIVFFEQTSRSWGADRITELLIQHMDISCVLVDGDHSYDECMNDLQIALRCLTNGGVIWVDDQGLDSVANAVKEFSFFYCDRIKEVIEDRIYINGV